jgi:hypothetical protein
MDRALVDYFDKVRKERGFTQQKFADLLWPDKAGNSALMRWRRIRGLKGYEPQELRANDIEAMCQVLGLDLASTTWRIQKEKEKD